jgi:hypothetical protein
VPDEITIQASDLPVTITMVNTGAALHNFNSEALDIDVDVNPGDTVEIEIPAGTAPGTYEFICDVPGHKEAGMVGTLIVDGAAADTTTRSDTPGTSGTDTTTSSSGTAECEGLADYQDAVERAYVTATLDNAEAARIFLALEETEADNAEAFDNLTPADYLTISAFFTDVADQLASIDPPGFAREWHQTQVDGYRLLSEFLEAASTQGVVVATIMFDAQFQDLESLSIAALGRAGSCPAFVAWAMEEG